MRLCGYLVWENRYLQDFGDILPHDAAAVLHVFCRRELHILEEVGPSQFFKGLGAELMVGQQLDVSQECIGGDSLPQCQVMN